MLAASLSLTGCFILDELNSGMDIMDEHASASDKAAAAEEPTEQAAPGSGTEESQLAQWKDQTLEWFRNVLEEEPPGPDPNDVIVRCEARGKVSFTRKSDCVIRGGRYVAR